jgi:hypothetical protein
VCVSSSISLYRETYVILGKICSLDTELVDKHVYDYCMFLNNHYTNI